MKKYCKFIIFCVLIISLIFLSCNNILLSKGSSLSIRLPGTEQSRFAFVKPESLDSFTIILTKKNGKTQEKTAKAGETIVFDSLTADTYTVSAKAFDKDNNCAAYAQEEVLIKPKQNTNLVLNLTWNLLTEEAIINNEVDFVVTPPKKTTYTLGEFFDPTGLKVEAVFKNGYRQEIPALIQSDTGPSQPIYYDLEPSLDNTTEITTASASFEIGITITPLQELQSNHCYQTIENPFTLTLNVPKPTILRGPTIDNNSNTSNNGKTATLVLETTEPQGFEDLGYIQEFQWYIVENGEAKKLEDNSSPDIPEYPYYRGTTEQILTITFDSNDTNTYQYYCKVTNTIQETPDAIPGITYGKTTATTKSKIVTVTTKGSSSDPGTTTTPTVSYNIGDVYPQNGTPMGVVFEVAADYIKIVALEDLSSDDGTTAIFKLAPTSWIDEATYPVAYNAEDGSINSEGFLDFVNSFDTEDSFDYTTDLPAFNLTWNYYVENAEDPQATAETFTWYIPAINELETIVMDTTGNITSALNENGTKLLEDKSYWSSTLVTDDSQPYSEIAYCMSVKTKYIESANVETAKNVRPVKKIAL